MAYSFSLKNGCGCDSEFSMENKPLEKIGKEDYEKRILRWVEHEKKIAIAAYQKVIDTFYESRFDPTIDYMKIFKDNL